MKYILNPELYQTSQDLSIEANCHKVFTIVESFSCKMITVEKKKYKELMKIWGNNNLHSLSYSEYGNVPDDEEQYQHINGKTYFNLIQALNSVYDPSFDFSDVSSKCFSREFDLWRMQNALVEMIPWGYHEYDKVKYSAWKAIDDEIRLDECEMYTYDPSKCPEAISSCPPLIGIHQIFYNRKMKRMLVVAMRLLSCFSAEYAAETLKDQSCESDVYMEDYDSSN